MGKIEYLILSQYYLDYISAEEGCLLTIKPQTWAAKSSVLDPNNHEDKPVWIYGLFMMRNFYIVYDLVNLEIGYAP
jgi:hypothetical protein